MTLVQCAVIECISTLRANRCENVGLALLHLPGPGLDEGVLLGWRRRQWVVVDDVVEGARCIIVSVNSCQKQVKPESVNILNRFEKLLARASHGPGVFPQPWDCRLVQEDQRKWLLVWQSFSRKAMIRNKRTSPQNEEGNMIAEGKCNLKKLSRNLVLWLIWFELVLSSWQVDNHTFPMGMQQVMQLLILRGTSSRKLTIETRTGLGTPSKLARAIVWETPPN